MNLLQTFFCVFSLEFKFWKIKKIHADPKNIFFKGRGALKRNIPYVVDKMKLFLFWTNIF